MNKILLSFILLLFFEFSYAQADCATAISVCGNSDINYSPIGIGNVDEDLGGCLQASGEHNSIWYKITIGTSGTLTFNLVPNDPNADYDWAMYGPNSNCGNLGTPIRCNGATILFVGASTGLNMASNVTSAPGGSFTPYCRFLDVIAGETYYLYIDNWVGNGNNVVAPFSLTWGGTATLASPFTDPALTPNPFVPPGIPSATPNAPNDVVVCTNPAVFDFSTLSTGILNGNVNFEISYHTNANDALDGSNPILTPQAVNLVNTYFYSIHYQDPINPNNALNDCKEIGTFKFDLRNIVANDATLTECNNNNQGTAIFDLTAANINNDPTNTIQYYPTMGDLNAGTNEIMNPAAYTSAAGTVAVKVTSPFECTDTAIITLLFHPVVIVNETILRSCFIEANPSTASFDLTLAAVTQQAGAVREYYPSLTDAEDGTNQIQNPTMYISPNGTVYVKVFNAQGCYAIAKVNLIVLAPIFSTVLKDKIICIEDQTTLDAGPGFDEYEWSNGAMTQTTDVGVGTYWVNLRTGECTTKQTVKVYSSEQPVVSSIDVSNNTITVNVMGGKAPYQYSMDNIVWQDSNVFTNISRGDHKVYVKDSYDCDPIEIVVVVPNLINVITPNGDGANDMIDYSALAGKQNLVFTIFDRYGKSIFQANKLNDYKWDGTSGGKKVPTGNYWYSVTWNENDKKNTPIKYTGWVMVKNRE